LNVTIPYKTAIIPYLNELDETAKTIGAVNTIAFQNGKTKGYNTDCFGFEQTLLQHFPLEKQRTAIILGTGGSAKAVEYVLQKYNFEITKVSRDCDFNIRSPYQDINEAIIGTNIFVSELHSSGYVSKHRRQFCLYHIHLFSDPTLLHRLNL
jgi:shikimate dehydrogenase